jgi:hypothetical protein
LITTLFSGSGPVGVPPVPWIEKTIDVCHFSSDMQVIDAMKVIDATENWLVGQPSNFLLLSVLQMLEQQAKKCIELCVEYVE